jgi:hypothetical protein
MGLIRDSQRVRRISTLPLPLGAPEGSDEDFATTRIF